MAMEAQAESALKGSVRLGSYLRRLRVGYGYSLRRVEERAKAEGVPNFLCMCNHVTIVPPLRALLDSPDLRLDGFIGPGHVATVVGARPFQFIPADYGRPVVISGFEPVDLPPGPMALRLPAIKGIGGAPRLDA